MKHVVYVTDAQQTDVLAVSLLSLLRHFSAKQDLVVHVLWAGRAFSKDERDRVLSVGDRCDFRRIEFHDVNPDFERYAAFVQGKMVWGRFFFEPFIDELEGNVLYLDTDTLVCEDVAGLFSVELGDNLVAAVAEAQFITEHERRDYTYRFMPSGVWRYFNGGVLVFNLKLFRDERVVQRVFAWYSEHRDEAICLDQDSLNAVAACRVLFLHPKYNYNDGWLARQIRCSLKDSSWRGCRPVEILEAILHPCICHFVGGRKPWNPSHRPGRKAYHGCMRALGLVPPSASWAEPLYDLWHFVLRRVVVPLRLKACSGMTCGGGWI